MSEARSAPRRRRRDEVLEAAAELFYEKGYEATSTADIAERLGILRGSVYYYLDTKEALLFELVEGAFAAFIEELEAILQEPAPPLERLRRVFRRHVEYQAENHVRTKLVLTESRSLSSEHRAVIGAQEEVYRRALVDLVSAGQQDGAIRAEADPEVAAMALLGAANWLHRWYGRRRGASPAEVARQFELVLLDGLAAPPLDRE